MGYTLISPTYSFVNYQTTWPASTDWYDVMAEGNGTECVLPVAANANGSGELRHQFIVSCDTSGEADTMMVLPASRIGMFIIPGNGRVDAPSSAIELPMGGGVIRVLTGYIFRTDPSVPWFVRIRLSSTQVLFYVYKLPTTNRAGFTDSYADHSGECFQLAFALFNSPTGTLLTAISNQFRFQESLDYTTFLRYENSNDFQSFTYCVPDQPTPNTVRLPMYLRAAAYPEEVSMYRKSDGTLKTTKEVVTKQYECKTDAMPEAYHDCLRVALMHSIVYMRGKRYEGQVRKNGNYAPEWEDNDFPLAPVSFKLDITPFVLKINTCTECDTEEALPLVSVSVIQLLTDHEPFTPYSVALTDYLSPGIVGVTWGFELLSPDYVDLSNLDTETGSFSFTLNDLPAPGILLTPFAIWATTPERTSSPIPMTIKIAQ